LCVCVFVFPVLLCLCQFDWKVAPNRTATAKSPGRHESGGSKSPGRMAVMRRLERAAVAAALEEKNEGAEVSRSLSAAPPQLQDRTTLDKQVQDDRRVVGPSTQISLDHLSSMLTSGQLQEAWGTTAAASGPKLLSPKRLLPPPRQGSCLSLS
jgi:hypothetical protein